MVHVAREMQKAGLRIPIMVGGATTSELHVALKIAPEYDGPVIWVKDASLNAGICARFLNEAECPKFEAELRERYEKLRQNYHEEQAKIASLSEARKNKLELFWQDKEYNVFRIIIWLKLWFLIWVVSSSPSTRMRQANVSLSWVWRSLRRRWTLINRLA